MPQTQFISDRAIYEEVVLDAIPQAKEFLWIGTADIKDLYVKHGGPRMVPFLSVLSDLLERGVSVRIIHAKEPGPIFRKDFDKYPALIKSDLFERILCPRIHTKAIIVDGRAAFIGSPNLTGAGMGAKNPHKRNFEAGFLTDEKAHLTPLLEWIDQLYLGDHCHKCQRRDYCPDPIA